MNKVTTVNNETLEDFRKDASWPSFYPCAPTMITCAGLDRKPNIIPVSSATVLARFPYTVGVPICKGEYNSDYFVRHSLQLIRESQEFVVNVPTADLAKQIEQAGSVSAKTGVDKFALTGLTPLPSKIVRAPIIAECPVNLECKVVQTVDVGSHDLFLGHVVVVHQDEDIQNDLALIEWIGLLTVRRSRSEAPLL